MRTNSGWRAFGQAVFFGVMLAATAYADCYPAPLGLVSWWQGESNKINAADGDLGAWGSLAFAQGMVGSGFFFAGADPVLVGNPTNLHLQDFTIETWIKRISPTIATLDTGNVYGSILSWGDGGYAFNMVNDGRFGIKKAGVADIFAEGVLSSSLRVTDTNFHHVAVTKSGSNILFYLDGTNEVAAPYDPGFTFNNTFMTIGAGWILTLRYFYGTVDELAIYSRALSPAEVSLLYSSGAMGKCPTPPAFPEPLSNPMVVVGSNAVLSARLAGSQPMSQQWFFGGLRLADNGHISGSTWPILTISNAQTNDSGDYFLVGSNAVGVCTSSVAHLSVGLPPGVTQAPLSQTNSIGSNTVFSVVASGDGPLSYGWRFNGDDLTNDSRIAGVDEATLSISNTAVADIGSYDVVITNGFGSVTSVVATLFVVTIQPVILTDPTNRAALYGDVTTFAAAVSGIPQLFYEWRKDGVRLADGGRVSGAQTSALTITNVQFEDIGNYQLVVSNAFGVTFSTNANLGVLPFVFWGVPGDVPPSTLTNTMALASGGGQYGQLMLGLKTDGTVAGCGHYYDGNTTHLFAPADIPTTVTNVVALSAGYDHGLARRSDGSVVGVGDNYWGQSDVPAGLRPAAGMSTAASYSLVVKSNGTVAAWGWLYGVGAPPPGLSNVVAIAAGAMHALALREDGTVVGWGDNIFGEINVPVGLSNVVAISAGGPNSLALKSDGTVLGWGDNDYGERSVPAGLSNVISIASGWFYNLALKSDGTVVGWGKSDQGQAMPPSQLTNVVAIGGGFDRSVALLQTPAARAAPFIWWQGSTNRILLAGNTTLFVPSVTGSLPMTFQWYLNGAPLPAQTNRWLVLPSAQTNQSGSYSLAISNVVGSAASAVASVQIGFPPLVTQQPLSTTNVTGGTVQFNAAASGSEPLAYHWYRGSTALADDARHFGSATFSLVISNLLTSDAGSYTLRVTSPFGSATSAVANLTVYIPPSFTVQPASRTVLGGSSFSLTVSATGSPPLRYQWVKNGTNVNGATSPFLQFFNARRTNSGSYFVIVTNLGGVVTSSTAVVKVHVPQRLTPSLQSGGQVVLSSGDSDGGLLSPSDLPSFVLLGSSNLVSWQVISNALTYTNGMLRFADSSPYTNGAYFYRVFELW